MVRWACPKREDVWVAFVSGWRVEANAKAKNSACELTALINAKQLRDDKEQILIKFIGAKDKLWKIIKRTLEQF